MKRFGYLYEKICAYENIENALMNASLGKRHRNYVKRRLANIEETVLEVKSMLETQAYVPSPYTIKEIHDGPSKKIRTICKPRFFPDQIIHWALILQIQDIIMKGTYEYSCGSIPCRGTNLAQITIEKWLKKDYKGTKYCLKMDVRKFYPSINAELLKNMFRRKIKDEKCLWLIDSIIESNDNGLPIGNYTSQWFSNFFFRD